MIVNGSSILTGTSVQFPILEYRILEGGRVVYADGFYDLRNPVYSDQELAGMGCAIIGNVCKGMLNGTFTPLADAEIGLRLDATTTIPTPWPGMPDDRPLPLDLTLLPFDTTMFLSDQGTFRHRVDRWALMRKIEEVWVVWLKSQLQEV